MIPFFLNEIENYFCASDQETQTNDLSCIRKGNEELSSCYLGKSTVLTDLKLSNMFILSFF